MPHKKHLRRWSWLVLLVILPAGAWLRGTGLFRGLGGAYVSHPDEPKQVRALQKYLQGDYVWYTGSWYYDGYPYGLNHVDEWILRPVLALTGAAAGALTSSRASGVVPDLATLYYWTRALRLLYGLTVIALTFAAARHLTRSTVWAFLAAALVALAPVSVSVSHYATGDVGVDLFGTAALLCLLLHAARPSVVPVMGAGLATGLAFSCKYHGALFGAAPAAYALCLAIRERRVMTFFEHGVAAGVGLLAGVLLGTPAFLVNPERTAKDIAVNFENIRRYCVSDELLALPVHEQALYGLRTNTLPVLGALGFTLVALAAAGLIASARRLRAQPEQNAGTRRRDAAAFAICLFPFLFLLVSLTGKLRVQPFHFSALVPALALAAATLGASPARAVRAAALAAVCGALALSAGKAHNEHFYWRRPDNHLYVRTALDALFTVPPTGPPASVRDIYVEHSAVPVFRNRHREVPAPGGTFWNRLRAAPGPALPYPVDTHWIFMNGPAFPVNDRVFAIPADRSIVRHLVFRGRPDAVQLVLRSGSYPCRARVALGGDRRVERLDPNEQRVVTLTPRRMRRTRPDHAGCVHALVRLDVRTAVGALRVAVPANDREAAFARVHGGACEAPPPPTPDGIATSEIPARLHTARFAGGIPSPPLLLDAGHPRARCVAVSAEPLWLPAGIYEAEVVIEALEDGATVTPLLADAHHARLHRLEGATAELASGVQTVTARFTKPLAPAHCRLMLRCERGRGRVVRWSLRPDYAAMFEDIRRIRAGKPPPPWCSRFGSAAPPRPPCKPLAARFGGAVKLTALGAAAPPRPGGAPRIFADLALERFPFKDFDEHAVFVHLHDRTGEQVYACDVQLPEAIAAAAAGRCLPLAPAGDLAPGHYTIRFGIWSARTRKRLAIDAAELSADERHDRYVNAGTLTSGDASAGGRRSATGSQT